MTKRNVVKVCMLIVVLSLIGVLAANQLVETEVSYAQGDKAPEVTVQGHPMITEDPYTIADIAEKASPAIVYIRVTWPVQQQSSPWPRQYYGDPFRDFFDHWFFSPFPYPSQPSQPISQGTGFIIDESGLILTNQHVVGSVGDNQEIVVTLNSPQISGDFEAKLLGSDSTLDLAVLQIEADQPLPTVPLGDSDTSRPGEWVIAIGNPYGKQFEHTVTVGVLSAKGREIAIRNQETGGTQVYKNLMQTDAAINRGNSGGPLLNIKGEVIGINTAVHAQAQGIGFAIPINVAKNVLDELIETGGVKHELPPRAWLGVWYNEVTPDIAEYLGLPDTKGVVIADVMDGSPALESGLRPFDVVRRVDDVDIQDEQDFSEAISSRKPGDKVMLTVVREGQTQFITVTLGDMPERYRQE